VIECIGIVDQGRFSYNESDKSRLGSIDVGDGPD